MRRWCFVLFVLLAAGASFAEVEVINYSVDDWYVYGENIRGEVNLTIEDVSYIEEIEFEDGSGISMIDFLDENGAYYECFPEDCSYGYEYSNRESGSKSISIVSSRDSFFGFVLFGESVEVDQIDFDISSDFGEGEEQPLFIEFFEDEEWEFLEFSENYLPRDWGCYSTGDGEVSEFLIGTSQYCELINLSKSNIFEVGVLVSREDDVEIVMEISLDGDISGGGTCSINFSEGEDACNITSGQDGVFESGTYRVCASASEVTDYYIYEDTRGESCGIFPDGGSSVSVRDYGIFAHGVEYANASFIDIELDGELEEMANFIISSRYGGDCSEGCVLPLKASGVSQNFVISNVDLRYHDNEGSRTNVYLYDIDETPAEVDFNGTLDLSFLNISIFEEGEYYALLDGEYLFEGDINIIPAPKIVSVTPLKPAAAVPTLFRANIDFNDTNKSLIYTWNFGDNSTSVTNVSYVYHTYRDLDNYTLILKVSAGGNSSSEKSFSIEAVSPREAVENGIESRLEALKDVREDIDRLGVWYKNNLIDILEIEVFESELARLANKFNSSTIDKEFRDIALELYALNVPVVVGANTFEAPVLMTEVGDIDIGPVATLSGSVPEGNDEAYANAILTWQNDNVDVMMKEREVFVSYLDGSKSVVLTSYDFDVTSKYDRESYFVINKPYAELYFDPTGSVARKSDSASIVILDSLGSASFNLYYLGGARGMFFASPALTSLVIEADISDECNYNFVCEKEDGENVDNCRSDCKPIGSAILIFVVVLIVILVLYTFLQIWYKKHYENYLFNDKAQLYNLLMYISNARARGLEDKKISGDLKKQGWSSERVDYAMLKSVGKTPGMIEIVPIEKISAWNRNRKARATAKRVARDEAKRNEVANSAVGKDSNVQGVSQVNGGFPPGRGVSPRSTQFRQGGFRRRPL